MAPKSSNSNTYKDSVKLDSERLKTNELQIVKVDVNTTNIKPLPSLMGILKDDVKLYMELLTADQQYALNDRTIHLFSQSICRLHLLKLVKNQPQPQLVMPRLRNCLLLKPKLIFS